MRKLFSLALASLLFAISMPASAELTDEPERYFIGTDEYLVLSTQGDQEALRKYNCPRGWDRVPTYRWDYRNHRWEFAGYRCRRGRSH